MESGMHRDMISSLPDDILTHVLSFLSTKEAVQTCILSKRWSNLWASVPVLRIDLKEWMYFGDDIYGTESTDRLDRFMDGVLQNREPSSLNKFEYFYNNAYGPKIPIEWFDRVVVLKPRVINIDICGLNELHLPDSLLSCACLQHLVLSIHTDSESGINLNSINLPSLKTLDLSYLHLGDDFSRKLFPGCCHLKRLRLFDCKVLSDISSSVLEDLDIDDCWPSGLLRISCPCLHSLSINCLCLVKGILLEKTASLVNANITLIGSKDYDDIYGVPVFQILQV